MKTILVCDDEENIRNVIKEYAKYEGYNVLEASNGIEVLDILNTDKVDLIILDIMMPKLDGYTTVKEIRKSKSIPIIILSARCDEYDKLYGFDLGIDDYVTKPFSPKELMARVKVNLNKVKKEKEDILEFKGLKIDTLGYRVYIDNEKISLTPKEYDLLLYLIRNKNIVLTREQILNNVWDLEYYGEDRTIDTHIKTLRSHLGIYRDFIITIRGVGYKFSYEE